MGKKHQRKDGAWCYCFTDHRVKRLTLYLGKDYDERGANDVALLVDNVVSCRRQLREPSAIDVEKLKRVTPSVRNFLVKHDLIDATPDDVIPTLKQLCDEFLHARRWTKRNSRKNYMVAINKLLRHFDGKRRLDTITVAECKDFRLWLETELKNDPDSTVNREIKRCRTIFRRGVEMKYISDNPFSKVKAGKSFNKKRREPARNATMENVLRVLEYSTSPELDMTILLARCLGLRSPSESKNLKFSDSDGEYLRVPDDTKTGTRRIPIPDVVRKHLEILKKNARPGQEYIFSEKMGSENTLGKRVHKLIVKAGLEMIKNDAKLWQEYTLIEKQDCKETRDKQIRELLVKAGIHWGRPYQNLRVAYFNDLNRAGVSPQSIDNWGGNSGPVRRESYDLTNEEPDLAKFHQIFGDSGVGNEPLAESFAKQMDDMLLQANEVQYEMDAELKKFGQVSKKTMRLFKNGMADINSFLEMFSDLTPTTLATPESRESWLHSTTERCMSMFHSLVKIDKIHAEIPPREFSNDDVKSLETKILRYALTKFLADSFANAVNANPISKSALKSKTINSRVKAATLPPGSAADAANLPEIPSAEGKGESGAGLNCQPRSRVGLPVGGKNSQHLPVQRVANTRSNMARGCQQRPVGVETCTNRASSETPATGGVSGQAGYQPKARDELQKTYAVVPVVECGAKIVSSD